MKLVVFRFFNDPLTFYMAGTCFSVMMKERALLGKNKTEYSNA